MTTSRLSLLSPQLDELMQRVDLNPREQHRAAVIACKIALAVVNIREPRVATARLLLVDGKVIHGVLRSELEKIREQLDYEYLELHESSNKEESTTALRLFSQARAIASLCYALASERDQWPEAIYEAAIATGDPSDIIVASMEAMSAHQCETG